MQIVFTINGRQALPVRAIPVTTKWMLSPDMIADTFARNDDGHDWRLKGVEAYFLTTDGQVKCIDSDTWGPISITLKSVSASLPEKDAGRAEWRAASIAKLPPGAFVWLNEFEKSFLADSKKTEYLEEDELPDAKITWPSESYFAIHPIELQVITEGFYNQALKNAATDSPDHLSVTDFEPCNLLLKSSLILSDAESNIQPKKRMGGAHAILESFERDNVPMNIESVWLCRR